MLKKLKNKKGFTLIEIIVVIVILAVLMAVAVPSVLSYINEGNEAKYETAGHSVYTAIQTQYAKDASDGTSNGTNGTRYEMTIKKSNLDGVKASEIKFKLDGSNVTDASCKIDIDGESRGVYILANKKVYVGDKDKYPTDHAALGSGDNIYSAKVEE